VAAYNLFDFANSCRAVREDSVPDDGLTLEERERRRKLEYDEADDYELNAIPKDLTIAQVNLASFPVPHENRVWHARLPNFLSLSSAPFDELMWEPELSDNIDSHGSDSSNKRKANVPNENVIRWKWSKDELGNAVSSLCL
jgi:RNA polymerase-associated protein LEO1